MKKGALIRGGPVLLLAFLFGLGFGLNYAKANQLYYLLEPLRTLHPTLWARDWLANCQVYHPTYVWLTTQLLRLDPTGLAMAWANVIAVGFAMLALHAVQRRLLARERALAGFCLLLTFASVTRTLGPGMTYAVSEYFQPSTLGALGTLAAAAAFIAGRPLLSGLCLAFAGAFHVNYLVLCLFVFGVAWLASGRERFFSRTLAGMGPPILVLCFFLPFLLSSTDPKLAASAQHIYQEIGAPFHYVVPTFAWDFSFWIGFQLLGAAVLIGPAQRGLVVQRRVLSLLFGCWLLVIPAALMSSVVVVRLVRQLFAWRICAVAELLAQAALAAALVTVFCDGRRGWADFDRRARVLAGSGVALLLLGSAVTGKWVTTLLVVALVLAGLVIGSGWLGRFTSAAREGLPSAWATGALLTTLLAVNVARCSRFVRYSNVLSGGDHTITELCAWVARNTPEDALFLTPPRENDIRMRCRRAIVVDWMEPARSSEILEWYARLEDVTGHRPFRGALDLQGYEELDAKRLARLRKRYGLDYVVVTRGHELGFGAPPVFSGQRFLIYALSSEPGTDVGSLGSGSGSTGI
ncbi:MAG: DUF6798 domain-containing protein [Pseudomonadota bacterium]